MRAFRFLLAAVGAAAFSAEAAAEQPHTTRIETNAYYGAVVTVEHGVRVIRPLPPTQHMIINPNGASPLVIGGNGVSVGTPEAPAESEGKAQPGQDGE